MSTQWMEDANCAGRDPELFFPTLREDTRAKTAYAKAICAACPVRKQCLDFALAMESTAVQPIVLFPAGVWGGKTAQERGQEKPNTRPCRTCDTEIPRTRALYCGSCREAADKRRKGRYETEVRNRGTYPGKKSI